METVINESFIFHAEWIDDLPQRFKERFSMLAINYAIYGTEPTIDEDSLEFSEWKKIKRRIDADKIAYKETCEKRAESGRRGGIAKGKNSNANSEENKQAENSNAKNVENENSKNSNANSEIAKIANANFAKNEIAKIADNEFDSDSEFDSDNDSEIHTHTEFEGQAQKNECMSVFLDLWDKNPEIFGIRTQGVLRPKDFESYFSNPFITKEYVTRGMNNFINSVKKGITEKRYIPSTPEKFILGGSLSRFQNPLTDSTKIASDKDIDLDLYKPVSTFKGVGVKNFIHAKPKEEVPNGIF